MARIPVPRDDLRQTPGFSGASADAFGAGVGEELQQAGRRIQSVDAQLRAAENARALDSAQAAAAKGLAELEAGYAKYELEAQQTASPDGAGYAEATKAEFDKRRDAYLASIQRPEVRSWAETQLARIGGRAEISALGFAASARAAKLATDMGAAIDLAANNLFTKPSAEALRDALIAQRSAIDSLQAAPEAKAQMTTRANNRLAMSYLQGLREAQPYEARDVIKSGALNALIDADQLSAIGNGIDAEIKGREAAARAEQAAARREAREAQRAYKDQVRDEIDGLNQLLDAGVPVPAQVIAATAERAAAAGMGAKAYAARVDGAKNALNTEWRGARPADMQARINELEARARADGAAVSPGVLIERDHLRTLLGAANAEIKADPLSYAAKAGLALPRLDAADPASFRARAQAARQVAARYGRQATLLTDEEAADYAGRWAGGNSGERQAVLSELTQFGARDTAAAFRQIAGKDPVLAHAGMLLTMPGGVTKARDIVTGREVLKTQPKRAPPAEARDETFAVLGGALDRLPGQKAGVADAARALYAARASRNGLDEFKPEVFERAVSSALGENRGADGVQRGGLGDYRGETVLLPSFMSADELDDTLRGMTADAVRRAAGGRAPVWSNGKPVADIALRNARPQAVGDGLYVLRPGGHAGVLVGEDGAPLIIDVRKLAR